MDNENTNTSGISNVRFAVIQLMGSVKEFNTLEGEEMFQVEDEIVNFICSRYGIKDNTYDKH